MAFSLIFATIVDSSLTCCCAFAKASSRDPESTERPKLRTVDRTTIRRIMSLGRPIQELRLISPVVQRQRLSPREHPTSLSQEE
uniref:Putative secreted protein n=1 Tax=Ixodes ricinus TaxID=34613 RepID=A0A6B0U860_IXORI